MRKKVILACTKCSSRNYSTHKKAESTNDRLEVKKFCKRCGEHTLHRETK
ncbi:50S ribosomal protein L33 [Salimicrobium halophilum]|uniref:Large ribosomal subunit protein bL33 n=1 Tax=Salimicrobium halophilum TaxID=86666 RepID=A0A1G8W0U5_9BACI|nr:50S ribosomal protein L33 [Salimicrobium halophilum]SDJ71080.1 LSU ribosomal protein L33P [Salimicrobium halophilum]